MTLGDVIDGNGRGSSAPYFGYANCTLVFTRRAHGGRRQPQEALRAGSTGPAPRPQVRTRLVESTQLRAMEGEERA